MAGTAAHRVDGVLPAAPVRQYMLAFPYELSGLAATRPDVLRALSRIFWEALRRRYHRWAKQAGHAATRAETGAVTGVHRASGSRAAASSGRPTGRTRRRRTARAKP
jgi:hypothetical protein